ncbi:MAG: PilZ domain-containing protein, partial [Myxococcota bacterium]
MGTAAALSMTTTKTSVLVPLKNAESFLDYYTDRGAGTIFVPGYVEVPSGTEVTLEIAFSDPALTFTSKGVVRWKRSKASRNLAAGIGVEFLTEEQGTRDLLLRFAKGQPIPELQQRARRFPALLDLEVLMGGAKMRARTQNISHTGAFIASPRLAEVHSVLPVTIGGPEPFVVDA